MRYKLLIALVAGFITLIVYLPVLQNGFVNWDDGRYVYENQNIQQGIYLKFLKWALSSVVVDLWHPLTMISLALDHAIWGLNPWGYHLTNILFHSLNTILVFVLATRLIEEGSSGQGAKGSEYATGRPTGSPLRTTNYELRTGIAAFVTALLFGVHPIHVESVAWVSERKDVLCAFFFLLCLLAHINYASCDNYKKKIYYGVSLASFTLALLSKPMAVSLPIVLIILDFYPLRRLTIEGGIRSAKQILIEKLPFLFLSLMASFITIWAHLSEGGIKQVQLHFAGRILVAIQAYMFYILKMLFPIALAPYYPYPRDVIISTLEYLGPFLLFLALTFLAIKFLKRHNPFSSIWFYYVVTLMPVIGIVQVGEQVAADRYSYLPSVVFFLYAGLGAAFFYDRYPERRYQIAAIPVLVFGIMALKTGKQIGVWHDSITFWSYEIKLYPDTAYIAYINRGDSYHSIGKSPLAIADFNRALKIYPNNIYALNGRGRAYFALGDYQQAIKDYNMAIINEQFNRADISRRNTLFGMGQHMRTTLAELRYNRGTAYSSLKNYEEALKDYDKAIELDPQFSKAYNNRGKAYFAFGNDQQAIADIRKAVEIDPLYARAYYNLSIIYSKLGHADEASAYYKKAESLEFKPSQ